MGRTGTLFIVIKGLSVSMSCGKVFERSWNVSPDIVSGREINGGNAQSRLVTGLFETGDDESTIRARSGLWWIGPGTSRKLKKVDDKSVPKAAGIG